MKIKPLARTYQILMQETDKELLIYDLEINKAYLLNETSALVFGLCDGQNSISEISQSISQKLKTNLNEDLVCLTLQGLSKDNFIANAEELSPYLDKFSRRELVKKVGLASMVALPLISSIVAPSALMAQSNGGPTIPLGFSCPQPNSTCESGTTCKTCSGCAISPACCSSSAINSYAPGTRLNAISGSPGIDPTCDISPPTASECSHVAALNCCSGEGLVRPCLGIFFECVCA